MKAIIPIGIQGVGKSTYAHFLEKTHNKTKRISKDEIRFLMFGLENYAENFDNLHNQFGYFLDNTYYGIMSVIMAQELTVIADETNHTRKERKELISFLRSVSPHIKIEAHYLNASIDFALRQNAKRRPEQIVPEDIIRRFHQEQIASFGGSNYLYSIIEQLKSEGFDNISIINAETDHPKWCDILNKNV